RKAAAYIESQFRLFGLLPAWNGNFQQTYPVYQDSLVRSSISINGIAFEPDSDFVVTSNSSHNISFNASEVLFAGYGRSDSLWDDYKNINARGKIVMVFPGIPTMLVKGKKVKLRAVDLYTLQEAALKNGAIGLLIGDKNFPFKPSPAKGYPYVNDYRKLNYPNTFFISEKIASAIMGADFAIAKKAIKTTMPAPALKSYFVSVLLELDKTLITMESSNVLGYIEGTDKKEEAMIITAHYDHLGIKGDSIIYQGADDDGSGTVAVLEIAKAFAKSKAEGKGPRRSIIFMTVSGEEEGLWGSSYYSENPAWPLDKTSVDLNIDMIGRTEARRSMGDSMNYVYIVGDNRLSSDLRTISEETNNKFSHLLLDYKYNDPNDPEHIFERSDHYNFARKGVPIIFYFNGIHEDYHRPSDTPDKINYEILKKRAQFIFYTAWNIANREDMIKRDLP
ncbi:MAG: M28 family peptidase, partial [Flavitalea sp.]